MESLRKSFIGAVACALAGVIVLSGLTIWLCLAFQRWLLPDPNAVYVTVETTFADGSTQQFVQLFPLDGASEEESNIMPQLEIVGRDEQIVEDRIHSIEKIENSAAGLSPKRKFAYRFSQGAMIGLPFLYSVAGILLCALWFYKKKLAPPIRILSEASSHIAEHDLDFTVEYSSRDELGDLCRSFEQMRQALYENNRELWSMLEERRLLQASVAHDLRNPIAVIEGYAEHLQLSIEAGNLTDQKLLKMAANLQNAAGRLSSYTESIRHLNKLEELEIHRERVSLPDLLAELMDDFSVMAGQKDIELKRISSMPEGEVLLDRQVFFRIFENIVANALRYARETIQVEFTLQSGKLFTVVADDGEGFTQKLLKQEEQRFMLYAGKTEHRGMGLAISRVLCKRHGGELRLANRSQGGASVTIVIKI